MDRAFASGAKGREFESLRAHGCPVLTLSGRGFCRFSSELKDPQTVGCKILTGGIKEDGGQVDLVRCGNRASKRRRAAPTGRWWTAIGRLGPCSRWRVSWRPAAGQACWRRCRAQCVDHAALAWGCTIRLSSGLLPSKFRHCFMVRLLARGFGLPWGLRCRSRTSTGSGNGRLSIR